MYLREKFKIKNSSNFYMVGGIADVIAKADKMSAEAA